MKTVLAAIALVVTMLTAQMASAGPAEEVRAVYDRFVSAQNAHDLVGVRAVLLDSPRFLWVSDGKSVWGPDRTLERMAQFQRAEVWRVEPDLAVAVAVPMGADVAFLHLPLALVIGAAKAPDRLRFLVSVLGVATPQGWRIAALFTTTEKAP
jgi:hypothetical protein